VNLPVFLALSVHLLVGAAWFGAMAYSLFVVQPRSAGFFEDERQGEAFAAEVAAGARWPVLGAIGLLALSGAALVATEVDDAGGAAWWALISVKVVLLAAVAGLFAQVSWRLWPRRLFASHDELPALRRRFRLAAVTLLALVALESLLGSAARTLA
jgi:putative copper export protein